MINTINLPPFKKMCVTIGNLPSSFMESMTYYEALCWLYDYFEKTLLPAINTNSEAITELQVAFTTLKNYVDTYFDNLDVQTEIDNKLDEMAQDGTLAEIIEDYTTIPQLTSRVETLESNTTDITNYIESIDPYIQDTMVVIGDSWSDWSDSLAHPDFTSENQMWYSIVGKQLNLKIKNYARGTYGYSIHGTDNKGFLTELQTAVADTTLDRDKVRYVIIYGGFNDVSSGVYSTMTGLTSIVVEALEYAKTNFPKSEIIVASINENPELQYHNTLQFNAIEVEKAIYQAALNSHVRFIKTTDYFIDQNRTNVCNSVSPAHPTEYGMKVIASKMLNAINGTVPETAIYDSQINFEPSSVTYTSSITNVILRVSLKTHGVLRCWIYATASNPSAGNLQTNIIFNKLRNGQIEPYHGALYEGLWKVGDFEWNNGNLNLYITTPHTTSGTNIHITGFFDILI